jgi:hypothetical protein
MDLETFEAAALDAGREMGELVKSSFGFAPVKSVSPVRGQALDVRQWRAIIPAGAVKLVVRGLGKGKPLLEVHDLLVGHGDLVRSDVRHASVRVVGFSFKGN